MDLPKNINWDAVAFFERLASRNKLAKAEGFAFCRVSGLEGFEEALHSMQTASAFIAVSDISQGYMEMNTTPHFWQCVMQLMIWGRVRSVWISCVNCSGSSCRC